MASNSTKDQFSTSTKDQFSTSAKDQFSTSTNPDLSDDPYSDPAAFWAAQGNGMTAPWDPIKDASPDHVRQEAKLTEVLRPLIRTKSIGSIFEAGCGRGRLAHFFARTISSATYSAIDVGQIQLAEAQRIRPDGDFHIDDITSPVGFAGRNLRPSEADSWRTYEGYDLVVTSEVLMHVRPGVELAQAFANLVSITRPSGHILIIEWVPTRGELEAAPTAYWNFPHDYEALFYVANAEGKLGTIVREPTDRQMIYLIERR